MSPPSENRESASRESGIRELIQRLRQRWAHGKSIIRQEHENGAPGKRSVHALADLADAILLDLHRSLCDEQQWSLNDQLALILHGGCGRREFAPFSDIDLMVLHQPPLTPTLGNYAQRLMQDINDIGFKLGFSIRTVKDTCALALKDPTAFSSLTESRFLGGNVELYTHFIQQLQRFCQRHQAALIDGVIAAREQERQRFGETVYLLRPNVKKSRGALRDTHLIRWLGFVRFGETDLDQLCRLKAINSTDATSVHGATEFLLRVRCDLHFNAKRAQDGLGRNEQLRIAEKFGYTGSDGVLPVEAMMQDYFRHTSLISEISDQFSRMSQARRTFASTVLAPITNRLVDNRFLVSTIDIRVLPEALDSVKKDLYQVLRLCQLSSRVNKPLQHETWLSIRDTMTRKSLELTEAAVHQFMNLLSADAEVGKTLRLLHQLRVLEQIIPSFRHAHGLLQFNEYHVYTVDEHTLRAVEICAKFAADKGELGRAFRQLRDKNILLLALLLHDLGKGYPEDHCEVGRRIAQDMGQRLLLSNDQVEEVKFLVHNHLMMSHLAFHRDIGDESLIAEFAGNVGTPRALTLLYLLTVADIDAVGPEVLNPWKLELLTRLYLNTHAQLLGRNTDEVIDKRFAPLYQQIAAEGKDEEMSHWLAATAPHLPWNYCAGRSAAEIAGQLIELRQSSSEDVQCWIKPRTEGKLFELCLSKRERIRSGIFYKITGLLASLGLKIHSADIKPLGHSLIWYWFQFEDTEFAETPAARLQEIQMRAHRIATGQETDPPRFRATWSKEPSPALKLTRPETRIEIDNQTVESATIIDIFAFNKTGLLYTIAQQIFELDLDVRFARVSTYGHQVLDVFYVTDSRGQKILSNRILTRIRDELARAIAGFLDNQPQTVSSPAEQQFK